MGSQAGCIMAFGSNPGSYGNTGAGKLTVSNCNFTLCSSKNDGGAICVRGPSASIEDCRFVDISGAHWGGAVSVIFRYSYNFTRCVFIRCKAMSTVATAGNGGAINIWDELSGATLEPSFKIDHCYFEGNDAYLHGKDVALTLNPTHFGSAEDSFNHSLSRTKQRETDVGHVFKNPDEILNNLLPYCHGTTLYAGSTHKDVEYCGCEDYSCRTLEYTFSRFNYFLFLLI
jgi:hypothetical protein